MKQIEQWFHSRGWTPFDYQRDVWRAYADGKSGLIHAPTGVGKTYAAWLGPVIEYLNSANLKGKGAADDEGTKSKEGDTGGSPASAPAKSKKPAAKKTAKSTRRRHKRDTCEPIRVLWLTPLRALANDTLQSLRAPIDDLGLSWSVELRTGDASSTLKARQRERLPTALVTTPESLSLLLSYPESRERFATLDTVVVDEWHELLSTKRGVQTELGLARLRAWRPDLRTWGLSATLGNLDEALAVLLGGPNAPQRKTAVRISSNLEKEVRVKTLIPKSVECYPWAGHMGTQLVDQVVDAIAASRSSLLFTNTRSQAEIWFQALHKARPDWVGEIALHHGSLEKKLRVKTEKMLQDGEFRCVVCTSSLDLGVDFSPVDTVFQVGSPKGIARLLQRAGRSGHQPGAVSTIVCVPAHSFELVEFAAARVEINDRNVEPRPPLRKPLDVLTQHIVTIALGGGFDEATLYDEVRTTNAFYDLTQQEWNWCMDFCTRGGESLQAYPEYSRIQQDERGVWQIANNRIARLHRFNIGTITADAAIKIRYANGRSLGTIEESFISRLEKGNRFVFAGRVLELVQLAQSTALVRNAKAGGAIIPRWNGARFPLSTQLGSAVRREMATAFEKESATPEMAAALPLLTKQSAESFLPGPDELLLESIKTRDGYHWFVYPFEGRLVHEGLSVVLAHRIAKTMPRTIHVTCNDYGFELLSDAELPLTDTAWRELFDPEKITEDLLACLNGTQMARRQFRDIARIAGLILPGYPGSEKSARQLQASSDLFFDVFQEFDPANLLLEQARREVLDQQLEFARLHGALARIRDLRFVVMRPANHTPFSFPLWAERLRSQSVSSERWSDRVRKMADRLTTRSRAPRRRKSPTPI